MSDTEITWLSSSRAAGRLGIGARTLYRLIDEGEIPAYKFGRVIRLQLAEVNAFIGRARIQPGSLEHLYPEPKPNRDGTKVGEDEDAPLTE
jgi:excisionase family DNA binding protein